jgi:hypothetical protein
MILEHALAAAISINPNIPGFAAAAGSGPNGWIRDFYNFALIAVGILAFGAIVYGGVRYAASAGNPSSQETGRSWIRSALIGLLLLGGAYIILRTVNPNLINLQNPDLQTISISTYGQGTSQSACSAITCPSGTIPVNSQTFGGGGAQCSCQNSEGAVSCGGQDSGKCPNDSNGNAQSCVKIATSPVVWGCKSNTVVNDCGTPPNHIGNCTFGSCQRTDNNQNATSGSVTYGCRS